MDISEPHRKYLLRHWFYCCVAQKWVSLTLGAEPFLRSRHLCSYWRTSQNLMEPLGSLPCSQEPSTGPYPEPDQCSSYHSTPCLLRFILIFCTHLCLGPSSGLFPSGFPTNIIYAFLFPPHSCYMPCRPHPPWLSNYILGEEYKLWKSSLCSFI
jgi:hypothetical protein